MPAHFLTMISPGGGEGFFAAAGRPPEGEGLPPAGPIDIALLQRVSAEFGNEILGPPMASSRAASAG